MKSLTKYFPKKSKHGDLIVEESLSVCSTSYSANIGENNPTTPMQQAISTVSSCINTEEEPKAHPDDGDSGTQIQISDNSNKPKFCEGFKPQLSGYILHNFPFQVLCEIPEIIYEHEVFHDKKCCDQRYILFDPAEDNSFEGNAVTNKNKCCGMLKFETKF